jgi:LmbE family N-acetylglucosaminyl deacetylase
VTQQTVQVPLERILVVTAHPDDVDFGCAGSVATWTGQGVQVSYCIVTDGDAGGFDESVSRTDMARIRREEQTAAAREVGVSDLHFLGYPDGRVTASIELRRDIARVIRQVRPQRVLTQSPERNWQRIFASHPDHLATGEAALCAVYPDSRNPFAHPELLEEGFQPHTVPEVWLMAGPPANEASVAVDITDCFDRKVAALRQHVSQVAHRDDLETMLREWTGAIAKAHGMAEGRLAEAFRVVPTA